MGQKKDLTSKEGEKIVKYLGRGYTTLRIAKMLGRDHRTIKLFVMNGKKLKRGHFKGHRVVSKKDMALLKLEMVRNPLSSSAQIFKSVGLEHISKATRCRILREIGSVKMSQTRPPLNMKHKEKRLAWAKKYLKHDFSTVIWTDEMRATLDGPDGWARGWIQAGAKAPTRLRRQQGGGGVMIWAGLLKDEVIGPFRIADGVKMNSQAYCDFLKKNFLPWLKKKPARLRKQLMLMQDNAPSHAARNTQEWLSANGIKKDKIMEWPPCSPDLNCIENFWSMLKRRTYANGRQYTSKDELWKSLQDAAKSFTKTEIEGLTEDMDERRIAVISKQGNYISK